MKREHMNTGVTHSGVDLQSVRQFYNTILSVVPEFQLFSYTKHMAAKHRTITVFCNQTANYFFNYVTPSTPSRSTANVSHIA